MDFCSDCCYEYGYPKNWAVPEYAHAPLLPKFFVRMDPFNVGHLTNLKFVALPVPEIIRASKNLGSPWIRPRSLFSKIRDSRDSKFFTAPMYWVHRAAIFVTAQLSYIFCPMLLTSTGQQATARLYLRDFSRYNVHAPVALSVSNAFIVHNVRLL